MSANESTAASSGNRPTGAAQQREVKRAWGFRARGLIGGLILGPAGLLALFSPPVAPEDSWLGLSLRLLAWTAFLAALLMRLWATIYLGGYKEDTLISDGPYSVCRNPLYVGSLLIGLSTGLFLGSAVFVGGVFLTAVCYVWLTIPAEEALLRSKHGEAFDRYCASTPRLFPRFSSFRSEPTKKVHVTAIRNEARRLRFWILLPLVGELSLHLRGQPWWPHVPWP